MISCSTPAKLTWSEESVVHPKYRTVPHGSPDDLVTPLVLSELLEGSEGFLVWVPLSCPRIYLARRNVMIFIRFNQEVLRVQGEGRIKGRHTNLLLRYISLI